MAATTATLEAAADAVSGLGTFISLHTADPGTTGANEATGGSPAYARQATTWVTGDAEDGTVDGGQVTIDVPAGTYTHFGVWSAATAGTFVGGGSIPSTTLSAQGQVKVTPHVTATDA